MVRVLRFRRTSGPEVLRIDEMGVSSPGPANCVCECMRSVQPRRNVPSDARTARAAEPLTMMRLSGLATRYPHELSGGMRQRVGMARALTTRPRALLMDEPFGALDAQTRGHLQEELLQIWEHQRTTVLFVTHSIDEAVFLADRIAVFSPQPGRITGTVPVELPRPRDPETPRFTALKKELRRMLVPDLHGAALS